MTEAHIVPDFLLTPYIVKACRKLRPTDGDVYAVVYWFEKMKDGRCHASNASIARIARCSERAVQAALQRLEENGFIECIYDDETRRVRHEIKTKVRYARVEDEQQKPERKVAKAVVVPEPEVGEDGNPTPRAIAQDFFAPPGSLTKYRDGILEEIVAAGYDRELVVREARKFYGYWTELSSNGKKQRWQGERYFDVKRRLVTWMLKAGTYAATTTKKAGAGRTV